jgi:hypothetical protein
VKKSLIPLVWPEGLELIEGSFRTPESTIPICSNSSSNSACLTQCCTRHQVLTDLWDDASRGFFVTSCVVFTNPTREAWNTGSVFLQQRYQVR